MVSLAEAMGRKEYTAKVGDVEVKIRPTVADVARLMAAASKKEFTEKDVEQMLSAIVDMIARANPDLNKEDIEMFVIENLDEIPNAIADALGWKSFRRTG